MLQGYLDFLSYRYGDFIGEGTGVHHRDGHLIDGNFN